MSSTAVTPQLTQKNLENANEPSQKEPASMLTNIAEAAGEWLNAVRYLNRRASQELPDDPSIIIMEEIPRRGGDRADHQD